MCCPLGYSCHALHATLLFILPSVMVYMFGILTLPSFLTPLFVIQKKQLELYPSLNLNPIRHLFLKSLNLLNLDDIIKLRIHTLFCLSMVTQTLTHLLVLMNISKLPLLFIPIYSARQSCDGNLDVASVNTSQYGLPLVKIYWFSTLEFFATCITKSNYLSLFLNFLEPLD